MGKRVIYVIIVLFLIVILSNENGKANATIKQLFQVNADKNVQVVAGVLRNTGSGWHLFNDNNHSSVGISEVTNNHSYITVKFDHPVKNVISFTTTPDETMAKDKIFLGATVGLNEAKIYVYQNQSIQSYITYNGSEWVTSGDVVM